MATSIIKQSAIGAIYNRFGEHVRAIDARTDANGNVTFPINAPNNLVRRGYLIIGDIHGIIHGDFRTSDHSVRRSDTNSNATVSVTEDGNLIVSGLQSFIFLILIYIA